ncbi:MAG TPA: hypothetical protein VF339_16120 [Gammaproteobacteria bacterium]
MGEAAKRPVVAAALLWSVLTCAAAFGQSDGDADDDAGGSIEVDEEVVVRGRSRGMLRAQIQLAEEAVYARFNEINSNDEFDIHCRRVTPIGSNISRRVCEPNFWRNVQARAGEETVRALQGSSAVPTEVFLAEGLLKYRLLDEEMRRLTAEDEELRRSLVRLVRLMEADSGGELPPAFFATVSVQEKAGETELPYDAAIRTSVRIGRDPWTYALALQTFTIAHVYGEIRRVEVQCEGRRKQRLRYEPDVEWTLPEAWAPCDLTVRATAGTTFALYEFE